MPSTRSASSETASVFRQKGESLLLGWTPRLVGLVAMATFSLPVLVTIWNLHQSANALLEKGIQQDLLGAARSIAQVVDPELHRTFKHTAQESSPEYLRQIDQMDRVKSALDPKCMIKFVYTCIIEGDIIKFVLDTTPAGDFDHDGTDDKSHVMEVYEEPSETLRAVLQTGEAQVDHTPYQDRWGTFLSGYAPVLDAEQRVVAVAGVDIALTDYKLQQSSLRHLAILSALGAVCLAFMGGLGVAAYHRKLQRSVTELVAAGDEVMASVRIKSDFLAAMSHELRTPMNAVLGMAELLQDTGLTSQQQSFVNTIQTSGESLLKTLTDILDFSQLDAGRFQHELTVVNVRSLISELRVLSKQELDAKGLAFEAVIDPACPSQFMGNLKPVLQVLRHLIGNAIKFTERGSIKIHVKVESYANGLSGLHFTVQDTGIGMSPEQQEQLFQPFFQADGSTKRRYGGLGIGLAICKRLCEAMHGQLWVESTINAGSTFHVLLPAASAPSAGKSANNDQAVVWCSDSVTPLLVGRVMEKQGHTALCVQSLEEILRTLGEQEIGWVVLDASLATHANLAAVRSASGTARVVIVNAEADQFKDGRFDVVLRSPLRPGELREALFPA